MLFCSLGPMVVSDVGKGTAVIRGLRTIVLLSSFFSLSGLIGGCATTLTDPIGPDSSLVIGRVVINNKYPGRLGLMPMRTVERGITLQIKN